MAVGDGPMEAPPAAGDAVLTDRVNALAVALQGGGSAALAPLMEGLAQQARRSAPARRPGRACST